MHLDLPCSLGYKSTRSALILTNSRNLVRTKKKYPYLRPACTLDMSPGPNHITQSYSPKNKANIAPPFRPWGPSGLKSRTSNPWCPPPKPHSGTRFTTRVSALSGCKNGLQSVSKHAGCLVRLNRLCSSSPIPNLNLPSESHPKSPPFFRVWEMTAHPV